MAVARGRTGHPLIAHRMGTAALEELGGLLSLGLGGVEGGQRFAVWRLGQSREGEETREGQHGSQG